MLKVTYFGTTTLLFDDGNDQVLFDAHITRPSLSKYIAGAKASTNKTLCDELISLHNIDRLRAVFISHTHHDHVMDAPYIANKCNAKIYGSESAQNVALGADVPAENITVFKHGDIFDIGDYKIRILNSLHSKPTILNNDLGEPIKEHLTQPAGLRDYKEGGSYDFYIEYKEKKILIRPSFNYIEGQLDDIRADVLFLGVAGLAKADHDMEKTFFKETVEKSGAKLVIPIHWDNFFSPLDRPIEGMPHIIENTGVVFYKIAKYCELHEVNFLVQYPRTSIEL
ncbi:L-ascorbate metabolism protein UlaG, beta-lactamase superfamily [Oribacterium sp. KHPX15]|uniref:MBL fold metallo-hydrolase n=1 Tax=Oribacterium sp. KHPX15 TaxID=1855342 RepID=UPI000899B5B9|nr:MBL fold metallo-hydrolase [Oribacterium sp. KHPX15]SEA93504.1 L-ascorbate metabolism protein UlaG, beta-lactamase superfamily [Oribacterium sp. KHPX15]